MQNTGGRKIVWEAKTAATLFTFLMIGMIVPISANAAIYNESLSFSTTDQSMWGAGGATIFDFNEFVGLQWNESGSAGGITTIQITPAIPAISTPAIPPVQITPAIPAVFSPGVPAVRACAFGKCVTITPAIPPVQITPAVPAVFSPAIPAISTPAIPAVTAQVGGEVRGATDGTVGLEIGAFLDSGSVNVTYPVDVTLLAPDPKTINPGETFSIGSSFTNPFGSMMTTQSPTVGAHVDLIFDVFASVGGEACVVGGCVGGDFTLIDVNATQELVAFNRDKDNELRVLGIDTGIIGSPIDIAGGLGSVQFDVPDISTSTDTLVGGDLHTAGRDDLLTLLVDLDAVATKLLRTAGVPVPDLEGTIPLAAGFSASYNILDVEAGPVLVVDQEFWFDPNLMLALEFDSPVQAVGGALSTSHMFAAGSGLNFIMPDRSFNVTPTFWLNNTFRNDTDFDIDGLLTVEALSASFDFPFGLGGLGIGPLFSDEIRGTLASLGVFDQSFQLGGFEHFTTAGFEVVPTPEPGTVVLLGTGLAFLIGYQRKRKQAQAA